MSNHVEIRTDNRLTTAGDAAATPEDARHLHAWPDALADPDSFETPDHIRAFADAVKGVPPRSVPERERAMRLSGLEPFSLAG